MTGTIHLIAAYLVFGLGLSAYVYSLVKRRMNVEREIEEIRKLRT